LDESKVEVDEESRARMPDSDEERTTTLEKTAAQVRMTANPMENVAQP
jgi:hypothetical protein